MIVLFLLHFLLEKVPCYYVHVLDFQVVKLNVLMDLDLQLISTL